MLKNKQYILKQLDKAFTALNATCTYDRYLVFAVYMNYLKTAKTYKQAYNDTLQNYNKKLKELSLI